jgi:hypothetical protein
VSFKSNIPPSTSGNRASSSYDQCSAKGLKSVSLSTYFSDLCTRKLERLLQIGRGSTYFLHDTVVIFPSQCISCRISEGMPGYRNQADVFPSSTADLQSAALFFSVLVLKRASSFRGILVQSTLYTFVWRYRSYLLRPAEGISLTAASIFQEAYGSAGARRHKPTPMLVWKHGSFMASEMQ